jgi:hypothetical protein
MAPINSGSFEIQDIRSFQGGYLQRGKKLFHELQTKTSQVNRGPKLYLGDLCINIKQTEQTFHECFASSIGR